MIATLANDGNNSVLNINLSNSTFYGPLTTKGITNSTNAITNNSTLSQVGASTFSGGITNNGVLTQNSTANINSGLNVTGLPYFIGTSANFPTSTSYSSKNGLEIYWNVKSGQGDTVFLNHSQGGSGGFNWWSIGTYHYLSNLMYLDDS